MQALSIVRSRMPFSSFALLAWYHREGTGAHRAELPICIISDRFDPRGGRKRLGRDGRTDPRLEFGPFFYGECGRSKIIIAAQGIRDRKNVIKRNSGEGWVTARRWHTMGGRTKPRAHQRRNGIGKDLHLRRETNNNGHTIHDTRSLVVLA